MVYAVLYTVIVIVSTLSNLPTYVLIHNEKVRVNFNSTFCVKFTETTCIHRENIASFKDEVVIILAVFGALYLPYCVFQPLFEAWA